MNAKPTLPGFCRDCLSAHNKGARCAHCGSPRLVIHKEVEALAIAHLDCDAFYAAVEKRDNPDLRDKPLIIGGGKRGVVATACYIARIKGVGSAMPMFKARKLCPEAIVLKPDMEKYARVGQEIRKLMREMTPLVEPLSIDEAFMDLTGTEKLHKQTAARIMASLAKRIEEDIGISVSIGLSYNKFLAKIASDLEKPRGFSVIGRADAQDFLLKQPVDIIWGVGKALKQKLARDGITNITNLRKLDKATSMARYGVMGARLYHLARGEDDRKVSPNSKAKSISTETTFSEDINDLTELERQLWLLCEKTSQRAKIKDITGATATLKLKTANFKNLTRNRKLTPASHYANDLFQALKPLLREAHGYGPFRLIGAGLAGLVSAHDISDQMQFLEHENKSLETERALDKVRNRFGKQAIVKGRALKS